MNALDLEFADNSFDAVFGGAILHHLPQPGKALEEWLRVTRTTGDVTVIEPNYLFPKDLLTAHVVDEERHKTMMAPSRISKTMQATSASETRIRPCIYTPPWPASLHDWFDAVDERLANSPAKWLSQMLLLQLEP